MGLRRRSAALPRPAVVAPETLRWRSVVVQGRRVSYGEAGDGPVLVFLHGWGIGYRSYKAGLAHLVGLGFRVLAPGLPGLGGTADLPSGERTLQGYARWLAGFLDALGVAGPVTLVGHSFGGGVAIATAHASPERVSRLVLVNSIGGSAWSESHGFTRSLAERPLWDWGLHLQADVMPLRQLRRVLPVILEDAIPNLLHNPRGVARVANIARRANLEPELGELATRGLPIVIIWGEQDTVLPRLSFEALCVASGAHSLTVPGGHSWLLADPAAFGEVMTNVIGLADKLASLPVPPPSRAEETARRSRRGRGRNSAA